MTQQNESNGHSSHPSQQASADPNASAITLEGSVNDDPTNTSACGEAVKGLPINEKDIILSPNGSKESNERAPSYIPVSTTVPLSQSTPISSNSTDAPQDPSTSTNEGVVIDPGLSDKQEDESKEVAATVPPAIPPHKASPNESSNVCSSDNTSVSTPIESTNTPQLPNQTVASNENGAIPKPKPNKPRSRNRHKR